MRRDIAVFYRNLVGLLARKVVIFIGIRTFSKNTSTAAEWMNVLNTNPYISRDLL